MRAGRRADYLAFLREARVLASARGGIDVRLLEDPVDDHRFTELLLYDDASAYDRERQRDATDPAARLDAERWRALLAEPPVVEVWRLVDP